MKFSVFVSLDKKKRIFKDSRVIIKRFLKWYLNFWSIAGRLGRPAGRHAIKSRNLFGVQVAIILWPATQRLLGLLGGQKPFNSSFYLLILFPGGSHNKTNKQTIEPKKIYI